LENDQKEIKAAELEKARSLGYIFAFHYMYWWGFSLVLAIE